MQSDFILLLLPTQTIIFCFTKANFQYAWQADISNFTKLKQKTSNYILKTFRKSSFQTTVQSHFFVVARPICHPFLNFLFFFFLIGLFNQRPCFTMVNSQLVEFPLAAKLLKSQQIKTTTMVIKFRIMSKLVQSSS